MQEKELSTKETGEQLKPTTKEDIVMAGKNTAVFGIYPTCEAAERGVDALKAAGFRNTDISVLLPQNVGSKDLAHEKHTKLPEGATAGAGTGALLGGALGWLAGIRSEEHTSELQSR